MKPSVRESGTRLAKGTRKFFKSWDRVLRPAGDDPWFDGAEKMPDFDPENSGYSDVNAWWLSELSRIVYTPDSKERTRFWHRRKPSRELSLNGRTPFSETHSFHEAGCHAAIFRGEVPDRDPFSVLCFRGTSKMRQWILNVAALPASWVLEDDSRAGESPVKVHRGFRVLFEKIWPGIEAALAGINGPVFFAGHSLGAAFATLAATRRRPFALYTFGSPRTGSHGFAESISPENFPHYRVVNAGDIVCSLPPRNQESDDRDFKHGGKLILLGETEETGADGLTDEPLRLLARSLQKSAVPPACILAHLPKSYSDQLQFRIQDGAI